MATFYLLPPRECLEQALGEILSRLLPGLPIPADAWEALTDQIGTAAGWPADLFLVPRDDLPEGESVGAALAAAFGAEPGDRVVDVGLARGPGTPRGWILTPGEVSSAPAAR